MYIKPTTLIDRKACMYNTWQRLECVYLKSSKLVAAVGLYI